MGRKYELNFISYTMGYISNSFKTPNIKQKQVFPYEKACFFLNLMCLFNKQNTCGKEHLRKIIGYDIENLE